MLTLHAYIHLLINTHYRSRKTNSVKSLVIELELCVDVRSTISSPYLFFIFLSHTLTQAPHSQRQFKHCMGLVLLRLSITCLPSNWHYTWPPPFILQIVTLQGSTLPFWAVPKRVVQFALTCKITLHIMFLMVNLIPKTIVLGDFLKAFLWASFFSFFCFIYFTHFVVHRQTKNAGAIFSGSGMKYWSTADVFHMQHFVPYDSEL